MTCPGPATRQRCAGPQRPDGRPTPRPPWDTRAPRAARGHLAGTAGSVAVAACQGAHAVLASRGQWVTNEKTLLDRAGLRSIDAILAGLTAEPGHLLSAVERAAALLRSPD